MWDNVIDHRCRRYPAIGLAHDAERVRCEVGLASLLPSGVVPALSCAASPVIVLPVADLVV